LPVVDNYFLFEEPLTLLNKGNFKKCPILLGVNQDEANWFYIYQFLEYKNLSALPPINYEAFKIFLTSLFHFYPQYPSTASKTVIDAIINKYSYWNNIHNIRKNIEMLDDAPADYHFICPSIDLASTYTLNNLDVFFYHFTQRATNHLWPDWFGVLHADEIQFVFGEPLLHSSNFSGSSFIKFRILFSLKNNNCS
jgi:carboxylesterase type B